MSALVLKAIIIVTSIPFLISSLANMNNGGIPIPPPISKVCFLAFFISTACFSQQIAIEIPVCEATNHITTEDHEIHYYTGFTLCYRESYELAEWVAYVLTADEVNNNIAKRNDNFIIRYDNLQVSFYGLDV